MRRLVSTAALLGLQIAAARPSFGLNVTENSAVNGKQCDVVTWTDAAGQERSAALVRADGDVGGYKGGYVERFTYYHGASPRTCSSDESMPGVSGMGCAVNHHSGASTSKSNSSNATTGFVFQGANHCIWRFGADYSGDGKTIGIVIDYFLADGRSDILWAVSYDCGRLADQEIWWDARGPYFQFDWDGDGQFFGTAISGIRWGDKYAFRTTSYSGQTSSWDYSQPNTIPYMMLYKDAGAGDAECGVIQTQTWLQQDAAGYWWADIAHGKTSADFTGGDANGDGAPDNQMPANWNCPYQLNAYEGYSGEKMAWGTNSGYVGSSSYDRVDYSTPKPSGYPKNGYSTMILIGRHSDGLVDAAISSMEAVQGATFTASEGAVVTQGPDLVGLTGDASYQPAGWDHRYGVWLATVGASGDATVDLSVPSGSVRRPTFVFKGYVSSSPPATVSHNSVALAAGTDYHASVDTETDSLWVTLTRDLTGAQNTVSVQQDSGPQNTPPTVAITSPADGATFDEGQSVDFACSADDTDGDPLAYTWTSSLTGELGTAAGFSRSDLPAGMHTITVTVTDGRGGQASDSLVVEIAILDSDGDGLPDWWESQYGLNPDLEDSDGDWTLDPDEDEDGDDRTNLQEYQAGTDPTVPDGGPGGSTASTGACGAVTGANVSTAWLAALLLMWLAAVVRRERCARIRGTRASGTGRSRRTGQ